MTLICVPITVTEIHTALADAQAAADGGADLVEYRIDEFFNGDGVEEDAVVGLVAKSPLPCIVTCRIGAEGGAYDGPEDARVSLFERLGTMAEGGNAAGPRYLDVEFAAYKASANIRQKVNLAVRHPGQQRDLATSLILSAHDFDGRPGDLLRRLSAMDGEAAAAVVKIAYRARSLRDSMEILDLPRAFRWPMIALGMGEFGLMTRVLAPKFGGFLTFASLRPTSTTAPGQPTLRDLIDLYRVRSIGRETAVYGVVGWPVTQSLSPHIHNAGFEAVGHNGVYLPLPIAAGEDEETAYLSFKATLAELVEHSDLDLRGVSVTIPYKRALVRLAGEAGWGIDAASKAIGAANTLVIERGAGGEFAAARIMNTDGRGLLDAVVTHAGPVKGRVVGIVGGGGVARSAAWVLAAAGARVRIARRAFEAAAELAEELAATLPEGSGHIDAARPEELAAADVLINCTPVGMSGGPAPVASAAPAGVIEGLASTAVVVDTVYNPIRTPLLTAAAERGLATIDGVEMFTRQAAAQFEAWTGHAAPLGLFDRVVRERLGAK